MGDAISFVLSADASIALVLLAGVHTGCWELFGAKHVRSVRDLKRKTVAVPKLEGSRYAFAASILKNVGLDPQKDVQWVELPPAEAMRLLAVGKVDAWMSFPPEPQELRAKKIGHVLVDTRSDRPWSQYFCCMISGNRDFVRKYPIATKKVVRAILKASELCATEPERIARLMVDRGYSSHYEYVVQMLRGALWTMARLQPRRDHAFLRAPPARGRAHQSEPAEDHRPGHRLALPQRAEERDK